MGEKNGYFRVKEIDLREKKVDNIREILIFSFLQRKSRVYGCYYKQVMGSYDYKSFFLIQCIQ